MRRRAAALLLSHRKIVTGSMLFQIEISGFQQSPLVQAVL